MREWHRTMVIFHMIACRLTRRNFFFFFLPNRDVERPICRWFEIQVTLRQWQKNGLTKGGQGDRLPSWSHLIWFEVIVVIKQAEVLGKYLSSISRKMTYLAPVMYLGKPCSFVLAIIHESTSRYVFSLANEWQNAIDSMVHIAKGL